MKPNMPKVEQIKCKTCGLWYDMHNTKNCPTMVRENEEAMKEIGREIGIPANVSELATEGPMTRKQFELACELLGEKKALELVEKHGLAEEE